MENITIRPGKKYAGLVERAKEAAAKSGRSLNNYVLFFLDSHLKNQDTNGQNAGSADGRTPSSESTSLEGRTD